MSMAANWKNVGLAFLDGFAPLDNLFQRPVRPGSQEDLIGTAEVWNSELPGQDVPNSGQQTEAYAAMRSRLIATIANLDTRFFPAPRNIASESRR